MIFMNLNIYLIKVRVIMVYLNYKLSTLDDLVEFILPMCMIYC